MEGFILLRCVSAQTAWTWQHPSPMQVDGPWAHAHVPTVSGPLGPGSGAPPGLNAEDPA